MRLVKVTVKNFRTIKLLTFLPANHNVILGEVNAGKSTILYAIALTLDPDMGRREQLIRELDFHSGRCLDDTGKPIPIEIEVTLSGCSQEEREYFFQYWEPWDDTKKELLEDARDASVFDDPKYKFAFRIAFSAGYDIAEDDIASRWYYPKFSFLDGSTEFTVCPRADRDKVGFFLIPADRDVRKALSFTRYSALDKALRSRGVQLDKQLIELSRTMEGKGDILFQNQDFANIVRDVQQNAGHLLNFRQNLDHALSFELSGLGHYDVMNILRAFIALEGEDRAYPIAQQGLGAKQVLVLAALRMLAKQVKSAIVAVEEPETGLHPHMQRALTSDLLTSTAQTFITTHSTYVVEAAAQEYIFSIVKPPGNTHSVVSTMPATQHGITNDTVRKIAQMRTHNLSDQIESLFTPSVLLLEGPTDREALPVLFRKLAGQGGSSLRGLDELGIAPVKTLGKPSIAGIAPYYTTQLKKKTYAFVDNEESTREDNDLITAACDNTFILPKDTELEDILVTAASDSTIQTFIDAVTGLGDEHFIHAGTCQKGASGRRVDALAFLGKKRFTRLFAELLPLQEIPVPLKELLSHLNALAKGTAIGRRIQLGL